MIQWKSKWYLNDSVKTKIFSDKISAECFNETLPCYYTDNYQEEEN